jgi:hypothetical protein
VKVNRRAAAKAGACDDRDELRGVEAPPARRASEPRGRLHNRGRVASRKLTQRRGRLLSAPPGRRGIIAAMHELANAIAGSARRAVLQAGRSDQRGSRRGGKRKPRRPRIAGKSLVNMTAEQRLDFLAASDGKITWARYYAKWGPQL